MKIGPYTVVKEIGRGGMAQVLLARRLWDDGKRKACVIKVPCKEVALNVALLRQFEQEVTLSMEIQHDNIVGAFDAGNHDGLPYLVMEYVPGCNLLSLILSASKVGQVWDIGTAVHVVREVAYALVHAHNFTIDGRPQRVVHRDIASKNILISLSGGVLLSDFGVATSVASHTTHNHVKGTVAYMAPEHYLGNACAASDAFGLGAVFWELLEGRRFRADVPETELRAAVVAGTIPPLTRDVPDVVRRVVEGLLRADVADRMRLPQALVELEDEAFPNRRLQLRRMVNHLSGEGVNASGLSKAHFAASPELVKTLAAVKAAGVSISEIRRPISQRPRIPSDGVVQPVASTVDMGPPSEDTAAADVARGGLPSIAVGADPVPETVIVGGAGQVPGDVGRPTRTERLELAGPVQRDEQAVPPTARLAMPWAESDSSDRARAEARGVPAGPASAGRLASVSPVGDRDNGVPTARDARTGSPPLAPTDSAVTEHTDAHPMARSRPAAPRPTAMRLFGAATMGLLLLLATGLGVAAVRGSTSRTSSFEPGPTQPQVDSAEPTAVAVVPSASDDHGPTSAPPDLGSRETVEILAATDVETPVAEPSESTGEIETPTGEPNPVEPESDPEAASNAPTPPANSKVKPESVRLVAKRGFVDHAEIKIGRGKAHVIPGRGELDVKVPVGRRKVSWRTEPDGEWTTMRFRFDRGTVYTFILWSSGPRIGKDPDPGGGQ